MTPKSFDQLSDAEAAEYLADFLRTEGRVLEETIARRAGSDSPLQIGRESIVGYFSEFDPVVRPTYRDWGDRLPDALKRMPEHIKGEAVFSKEARICLLRMGYYFGEVLIKEFPQLSWGVGDRQYAHSGKPVVTGFSHDRECATIHVCETLARRIDRLGLTFDEYLQTLDVWRSNARK